MIKIIEGNILNASEFIIGHQTNCKGVMGAGLAKQIRDRYPDVYTQYKAKCDNFKGKSHELLGVVQFIGVSDDRVIANMFGQDEYGRDKKYTDYDALYSCLVTLRDIAKSRDKSIALPWMIGCGLAGGSWDIVYKMIGSVFSDYDVTLYKFNG